MLRFLTAGESHGQKLTAIIEGMPAGLKLDEALINIELEKRQSGFGRGGRMKIEKDKVNITSGIIHGVTIGSPISLEILNKDQYDFTTRDKVTTPRPGHADLSGVLKYGFDDITMVLERASARETAIRAAVGSVAAQLLKHFHIALNSQVLEIGGVSVENQDALLEKISIATEGGDTLGGTFEITVKNVPAGLGSFVHFDRKLDGRLAANIMSIQGIKGIEIGDGFSLSKKQGSESGDEISYDGEFHRTSNHAGGIEGGMSNGEDIIIKAVMKPIPTLKTPLKSVDINTKKIANAAKIRSDVCAVYAASIVGENTVAWVIAQSFIEKFGGDSIFDIENAYKYYLQRIKDF